MPDTLGGITFSCGLRGRAAERGPDAAGSWGLPQAASHLDHCRGAVFQPRTHSRGPGQQLGS